MAPICPFAIAFPNRLDRYGDSEMACLRDTSAPSEDWGLCASARAMAQSVGQLASRITSIDLGAIYALALCATGGGLVDQQGNRKALRSVLDGAPVLPLGAALERPLPATLVTHGLKLGREISRITHACGIGHARRVVFVWQPDQHVDKGKSFFLRAMRYVQRIAVR